MKRVQRYDGVTMSIVDPDDEPDEVERALGVGSPVKATVEAYRDPYLRISGRVSTSVRVTR
jgi:hypothetical protein